jgi:hypothetical protein
MASARTMPSGSCNHEVSSAVDGRCDGTGVPATAISPAGTPTVHTATHTATPKTWRSLAMARIITVSSPPGLSTALSFCPLDRPGTVLVARDWQVRQ